MGINLKNMEKVEKGKIIKTENHSEIGIPKAKWALLDEKTPTQFIKKRQGRGGMTFDYVETGYVVKKLNEVFNGMWDFEILEQEVGKNHIWVKGKLTVKFVDAKGNIHTLVKSQFGGSEVKKTKTGEVIDIADDLKAASSDALKKCASLLGVASDVYFQEKKTENLAEVWNRVEQETCQHEWREGVSKLGKKYRVCQKCQKFEWI